MSYHQFGHVDPEERLDYAEQPPAEGEEEYLPPQRRFAFRRKRSRRAIHPRDINRVLEPAHRHFLPGQ